MNYKRALPYLLIFILPFGVVTNYYLHPHFLVQNPIMVFGVIPLLDLVIGLDLRNPPADQEKALAEERIYRWITWACVPAQVGLVLWGSRAAGRDSLSLFVFFALAVSVGLSSGIMGINVSHELIHRIDNKLEPALGRVMLATVFYLHWAIEHVAGHHRTVATVDDPATARFGQSYYRFWPQTVIGGFKSAWDIEKKRMKKAGRGTWSKRNRIIWYMGLQLTLVAALGWAWGLRAVVFYFLQSFFAVSLLEVVNYLEHYGLERRKLGNGRYERVTPLHAWNNSCRLTNRFLFNLQRHSDHHADARRRYQVLRHFDESPQLPTGYAGMIVIALVPPMWRSVMDQRVREFRARLAAQQPAEDFAQ